MPFTFNPFSDKKIDFTKNIPEAPPELPKKIKPGLTDEDRMLLMDQGEKPTEKVIIKKEQPDDSPMEPYSDLGG